MQVIEDARLVRRNDSSRFIVTDVPAMAGQEDRWISVQEASDTRFHGMRESATSGLMCQTKYRRAVKLQPKNLMAKVSGHHAKTHLHTPLRALRELRPKNTKTPQKGFCVFHFSRILWRGRRDSNSRPLP